MTDRDDEHHALMGSLMAGVTHELSNPLAYMLANVEFVLLELRRQGDGQAEAAAVHAEWARALDQVRTGTLQLRGLAQALRALAQPAGHIAPVDISRVVGHALTATRATWKHVASVEMDVPSGLKVDWDEAIAMRWLTATMLDVVASFASSRVEHNCVRVAWLADDAGGTLCISSNAPAGDGPLRTSARFAPSQALQGESSRE